MRERMKPRDILVAGVDASLAPAIFIPPIPMRRTPPSSFAASFMGAAIAHYLSPLGAAKLGELRRRAPEGCEDARLLGAPIDYFYFDWDLEPVRLDARVCEIPRPGALLGVRLANGKSVEDAVGESFRLKDWVARTPFVVEFFRSLEAGYQPRPPMEYDVFISYTDDDKAVAEELLSLLRARDLKCFIAQLDIPAGTIWTDEIRHALHSSRAALLLLTEASAKSKWVLYEAGALWALETRVFPACMYADLRTLPEPISHHQARDVRTTEARRTLADEIAKYVGGPFG